ncbi:hypothetical protein POM88_001921 [Heracleum sosnowskyi]|uniref:Pentatricopeptide repeat-containing protein n=1 Tax=Heracleum sosnowskyi TaxID=360622 RepID=A0AAD8NBA7_9APIA|nr:hypothetical protein POM88_001921 [Heracleum sosnowskyi]
MELSSLTQTNISLPFLTATVNGPKHIETTLTRAKFEELCSDLLDRLKTPVQNSLRDAKLSFSDIDEVIQLYDRGLTVGSLMDSGSHSLQHVVTLFFGGTDDREALGFSERMGAYHHINLTFIRFLPAVASRDQNVEVNVAQKEESALMAIIDNEEKSKIDNNIMTDFYNKVKEMEEKKCKPDKLTFTILIIGHCMKGRMFEAINMFNKMLAVGCSPDEITIKSLISCLQKAGMPKEAHKIRLAVAGYLDSSLPSSTRWIPDANINVAVK